MWLTNSYQRFPECSIKNYTAQVNRSTIGEVPQRANREQRVLYQGARFPKKIAAIFENMMINWNTKKRKE